MCNIVILNSIFLDDFLREWEGNMEIEFEQVPFHHPLFIMFSSGTTGVPKCMVHSVGVCTAISVCCDVVE